MIFSNPEILITDINTKHCLRYDRSLVIVADQQLRRSVLFNEAADPTIELMNLEYCVLERIGRSRKHGELTQGNMSITSHLNMDPKSFFHYKKTPNAIQPFG
ncbi:hypothetical protein NQ314_011018 [Rhamnusium bicolor]|uniref:B-block binding subunit of TFIIIC domain-containing protein n=1 Tax=Rhamnusium bicolor TaxID=1586634 RepID=A0AAV8XLY2_9CUCU|nr:hypothetical protein NQ314_011018 [Rhamnusium bicolor]